MKHTHVDQLRGIADVQTGLEQKPMTRRERLERWAELLERDPQRSLRSLGEIEFKPRAKRHAMRADNSPLTVAFEDPILRLQGLASDTLGDATTFFDLSDREAHYVLCSCRNGYMMTAGTAAQSVRAIAGNRLPSLVQAWAVAGALVAVPGLIYLFG